VSWWQQFKDSKGVVKYGDYLYSYIETDTTHVKIQKTPLMDTTPDGNPTYKIAGDEPFELDSEVTIAAVVKPFKFIGAGGKIYLWDGRSTVITFDIATMTVTATHTYAFTITDITCDDAAYYIGQHGDVDTETPMQVHRITTAGVQTTYTGSLDAREPHDYYCRHYDEHYADFLYAAGGKLFVSCGSDKWDTSPSTIRWLIEIDVTTMTQDCRSANYDIGSTPGITHGFSDFVTDGTSLFALWLGGMIWKFTIGTMIRTAAVGGDSYGIWSNGHGMVYTGDGYILRTYGSLFTSTVAKYSVATLAKTALGTTYGAMGFYHAVSDGSYVWFYWSAFSILCNTPVAYPTYPYLKVFNWAFESEGNAIWFVNSI